MKNKSKLLAARNVLLSILIITLVGHIPHGFLEPVALLGALDNALWFWFGMFVAFFLFQGYHTISVPQTK